MKYFLNIPIFIEIYVSWMDVWKKVDVKKFYWAKNTESLAMGNSIKHPNSSLFYQSFFYFLSFLFLFFLSFPFFSFLFFYFSYSLFYFLSFFLLNFLPFLLFLTFDFNFLSSFVYFFSTHSFLSTLLLFLVFETLILRHLLGSRYS